MKPLDDEGIINYDGGPDKDGAHDKPLNTFASLKDWQRGNLRAWYASKIPVDTWWHHSSGREYVVIAHANFDSDDWERYPPTIVYEGADGKVWSRPAHDWMRSMTRNWSRSPGAQPAGERWA